MELNLDPIDYGIVILYFISVITIGFIVSKKTNTGEDLFLAGRSLGFFAIGMSLFASNISSNTLIGLAGAAYKEGLAISNYEWMAGLVLVFMSFFYIPVYLKKKITTVPEFLLKRFGGWSNKYFSAITIFLVIIVDTASGMYAGALVIKTFFPSLEILPICIGLALFTGIYTATGGLKAVVYTDVVQSIVLLLGCGLLTYFVFKEYDFTWSKVVASVPQGHMSLIRPLNDSQLPWLGTITGVPILGFWYWATNQYITQRVLGAKNVSHARWGAMFGAILKQLPLFIMVIPGAMAISLLPNLEKPDMVFPVLLTNFLPVGVTGLVLAGLIAAIMSSIDSSLNSASALIVNDFVKPNNPDLKPKQIGKIGKITTLILMTVAAVWAPIISNFDKGLFNYLQQSYTIFVPPIAALFFLGVFSNRGGAKTAIATLASGHLVSLIFFILGQKEIITFHFTIVAGITTFISAGFFFVFARVFNEKNDLLNISLSELVKPAKDYPWYLDYRYQSTAIIAIVGLTVGLLW